MDRNRNFFRQECIDFFETGAGMEHFCGLPEQEFRLTVMLPYRTLASIVCVNFYLFAKKVG